jgi:hypothetical protein
MSEATGDIFATRLERRHAKISPLVLLLKYQQQILTALSVVIAPLMLLGGLVAIFGFAFPHAKGQAKTYDAFMLIFFLGPFVVATLMFFLVPRHARWPVALMLLSPYGWIGLFWLGIERLVNRLSKIGGVIGIILGLLALISWIVGLDAGFGAMMRAADLVGERWPALEVCIALVGLPVALVPLYLSILLLRASILILRLSPLERQLMRDVPPGATKSFLTRIWGAPPTVPFARRPRGRFAVILALITGATLFFSIAGAILLLAPASLRPFELLRKQCQSAIDREQCIQGLIPPLFLGSTVAVAAVCGFFVGLGALCQKALRRLLRFSLRELQAIDPRPPVLFLRAFGDDLVPLPVAKAPWLTRLLQAGRRRTTLDHMLLDEATSYGPVVALGKPDDKRPPYGAARGYFNNLSWQDAVADLAHRGSAVVICLDDTSGIRWEVEHLVGSQHVEKTLFLVHPKHSAPQKNVEMIATVAFYLPLKPADRERVLAFPAAPKKKRQAPETVVGFFVGRSGTLQIVRSATHSDAAYLFTLRLFLRDRLALAAVPLPARTE